MLQKHRLKRIRPHLVQEASSIEADFRRHVLVRVSLSFFILMLLGTIVRHGVSPMPVRIVATNVGLAFTFLLPLWLARRRASPLVVSLPIGLGAVVNLVNGGLVAGGINAPVQALIPLLPVMGFCFGGRLLGTAAFVTSLCLTCGLVLAERFGFTASVLDPNTISFQRASIIFAVATASYVTGRTYEASRRYAEQRLVEASHLASLGTMAGGIAHEINNPLAIVAGYANQIERLASADKLDNAKLIEMTQRITQNTQRIAKIVSSLVTYARDDARHQLVPVRLSEIVSSACGLCAERFRSAGVELRIPEIAENVYVMARIGQAIEVLLGLLNNSFDAVKNLSQGWIEIGYNIKSSVVELSVTDAGLGIDIDLQSKIFTPFFTTKDVGQGTGLGLSLCASIMSQHGGDIFLDSSYPHTKFVLRFQRSV